MAGSSHYMGDYLPADITIPDSRTMTVRCQLPCMVFPTGRDSRTIRSALVNAVVDIYSVALVLKRIKKIVEKIKNAPLSFEFFIL